MSGIDGREPWADYDQLIQELGAYDPELLKKPKLVVANKMDEESAVENLKIFEKTRDVAIQPVSCLTEEGLAELKELIWEKVTQAKAKEKEAESSNSGNR